MAILPVHQMIERPDLLGNFAKGLGFGQEQRALREKRADEQTIRSLAPGAVAGDQDAYAQIAALDPERAGQLQGAGDAQLRRMEGLLNHFDQLEKTAPPEAVQAAWIRDGVPYVRQFSQGNEPTQNWAEAKQMLGSLRAKIAMAKAGAGGQSKPDVKVVGNALVDAAGNVLYQGQPESKFFQTDQGLVEVGPNGAREVRLGGMPAPAQQALPPGVQIDPNLPPQVQAAIASSESQGQPWDGQVAPTAQGAPLLPAASVYQRQASERADRADARAEEAAQRAREAQERAAREAEQRQKFGTIPPGFRVNAEGTALEPVPGGPKPAGAAATEGERKAATLLRRLEGSQAQLQAATREAPDAASPGIGAEIARGLPLVGDVLANRINSPERQRVEAAQLDILDAALTLGTGAAYTREQLEGYRRAFFPQIGDDETTIADKAARLQNVIQAAKIAAGRAAPAEGTGVGQGGGGGGGAPAQAPQRIRYDAQGNRINGT